MVSSGKHQQKKPVSILNWFVPFCVSFEWIEYTALAFHPSRCFQPHSNADVYPNGNEMKHLNNHWIVWRQLWRQRVLSAVTKCARDRYFWARSREQEGGESQKANDYFYIFSKFHLGNEIGWDSGSCAKAISGSKWPHRWKRTQKSPTHPVYFHPTGEQAALLEE